MFQRKKRIRPASRDKPWFMERFIDSNKGRRVFAAQSIESGDFDLEYRGELISVEECRSRLRDKEYISVSNVTGGILLMMALCEQVHVYEYIPSMRQTDLCHYHERYYDAACTLGAYHPLLYEKSLIQRINTGPENDLRRKGRVTLPGLSTVNCDI